MERRTKALLVIWVIFLLIITCIHPVYPNEIFLQHIPTVIMIAFFIYVTIKNNLSNKAFLCLVLLITFHIIGARWNYSNTPYNQWIKSVSGFDLHEFFGFKRNHYDRLVHFVYGLFMIIPASEIYNRWLNLPAKFSKHVAFLFVLASSLVYELMEWGIAIVMSPEQAEAYNGQQGDWWDAQKDMALAMFGALLTLVILRLKSFCR